MANDCDVGRGGGEGLTGMRSIAVETTSIPAGYSGLST